MAVDALPRMRRSLTPARWQAAWRHPALLAAGLAACGLHGAMWWGWAHQGLTGAQAGVAPAASAAVHVRLAGPHAGTAALSRTAGPEGQDVPTEHSRNALYAPAHGLAGTAGAPALAEETGASAGLGADLAPPDRMHPPAGPQWLTGSYVPADTLDQSPRPELSWFLDEDVLAPLQHGSMLVQLWVSAEGRIDRAELLHADPAGDWALRAMVPLPGTPMRPGVRGGQPVAATLVVELVSDNERFR